MNEEFWPGPVAAEGLVTQRCSSGVQSRPRETGAMHCWQGTPRHLPKRGETEPRQWRPHLKFGGLGVTSPDCEADEDGG